MKKGIQFIVFSCVLFLLAGCNFQTVAQYEQMEEQQQSIEQQEQKEQQHELQPEVAPSIENKPTEDPALETPKEAKAELEISPKENETPKEEAQKEQQPAPKKEQKPVVTEKSGQASKSQQPVKETTVKPQAQQPKKRVVTIAIQAKTLLTNGDLLDGSLQSEAYVPKDGVILKPTQYELLSEKETVWDVLQRATREHKIQLEYQGANENMYNSVYIEGINHLYEFSAGPLSGWMYAVNGVYPNYGCSQYVLQDGDAIVWNYTVDLGRDLGQSASGS